MGNAVAAVSNSVKTNKEAYYETTANNEGLATRLTGSLLLGGRPPFVLNTAVSDEDDDDEEEELGWDSDDDDDDERESEDETDQGDEGGSGEDGDDEDDDEEVIFSSSTTSIQSNLNSDIKCLEDERDLLKKKIKIQADEIDNLRKQINPNDNNHYAKMEKLEMHLFEKDAEIAALKASINDDDVDSSNHHQSGSLKEHSTEKKKIVEQSTIIQSLQEEVLTYKSEISNLLNLVLQGKEAPNLLDSSTTTMTETMETLKNTIEALTMEKQVVDKTFTQELQDEIVNLKSQITQMSSSNEKLVQDLQLAQKTLLQEKETLVSENMPEKKIDSEVQPTPSNQKKNEEDNTDEDDWGGSWGDDD